MNNNYYSTLANLLSKLTPFELTTLGVIFGYFLSISIPITELNSLGNWFELVGQILLTYSAQGTATPTNEEYNNLVNDVEMLKQIILSTVNSNSSLIDCCSSGGSLNAYNAVSYLLSINDEINTNNLQHLYYGVDYYNDTYHVYRCYCNNSVYEEHNWVLLSPYAIIPGPIRQVCSVCGVEKFE